MLASRLRAGDCIEKVSVLSGSRLTSTDELVRLSPPLTDSKAKSIHTLYRISDPRIQSAYPYLFNQWEDIDSDLDLAQRTRSAKPNSKHCAAQGYLDCHSSIAEVEDERTALSPMPRNLCRISRGGKLASSTTNYLAPAVHEIPRYHASGS